MLHCWRWTGDTGSDGTAIVPSIDKGQLNDWQASVDPSTGAVTVDTIYEIYGTHTQTNGKIAVFAVCQRASRNASASVPATAAPWDPLLPGNASLGFMASGSTSPVVIAGVTAGDAITITPYGTTVQDDAYHTVTVDASGDQTEPPPGSDTRYPSAYMAGYALTGVNSSSGALGIGGLCGAFTDSSGVVKGTPFAIGNGATVTVPAGATQLQFGMCDNYFADDSGALAVYVSGVDGMTLPAVADDFAEISLQTFAPGQTLRASTMKQLSHNVREAAASPELFGPTEYSDGDLVTLPTSPIDGYEYSRDELMYVWDWKTTGPQGDAYRLVQVQGGVDANGLVSLKWWRETPSSSGTSTAKITVLVIAMRGRQNPEVDVTPTTDPIDASGSDQDFQVNGS
jgi:hypothetical protein